MKRTRTRSAAPAPNTSRPAIRTRSRNISESSARESRGRIMLQPVLAVLLFGGLAFAEDKPIDTALPPVCGVAGAKFDVKTDSARHPVTQPEAGKALVYFLEDDSEFGSTPKPTTMASLDGQWVGATHGDSYFYFSV